MGSRESIACVRFVLPCISAGLKKSTIADVAFPEIANEAEEKFQKNA